MIVLLMMMIVLINGLWLFKQRPKTSPHFFSLPLNQTDNFRFKCLSAQGKNENELKQQQLTTINFVIHPHSHVDKLTLSN